MLKKTTSTQRIIQTYIFLLLMDVPDLKPNVFFGQRGWWNRDNISETLELISIVFGVVVVTSSLQDSVGTSAVACRLCPGGNKFHLPSRNLAAFS
jgi:hypothetical protein